MFRSFRVRLKRDAAVYSRDITVENATQVVNFDPGRAYRGYVEGDSFDCVACLLVVVRRHRRWRLCC